jgi:hypothetical protein
MSDNPQKTSDLQKALRQAAAALAEQISDASALTVETRWVEIGDSETFNTADSRLAASTTIQLDGDTSLVVPLRRENGVLVRDENLLQLHLESVEKAIQYRKDLLATIVSAVQQIRER